MSHLTKLENELKVRGSESNCHDQKCKILIEQEAELRSFKHCETEEYKWRQKNIIKKGRDVSFTVSVSNMGECQVRTIAEDEMTSDVNVVFKMMDISNPKLHSCIDGEEGDFYRLKFIGSFFPEDECSTDPADAVEEEVFGIHACGRRFIVGPGMPMKVYIITPDEPNNELIIGAHKIVTFSMLCQVENIECGGRVINLTEKCIPCDDHGHHKIEEVEVTKEQELKDILKSIVEKLD